jgi:hypothetical protein
MTQEDKEVQQTERQILLEKYTSALKKTKFINEIKDGLGNDIKLNGGKVKIIKKTKIQRFKGWLKGIFTKF